MDPSPHNEAVLKPATMVDHFKVARLVGRGGMGEVYLARDMKLGRKVALKVVHPETLGDAASIERFQFEARVTARFNHPHIVMIYAVGEHQGSPYVALEYLEGQTLRERMTEERPGVGETLRIGLAIAEALREAHTHQILHRDLKPENVVIPRDGRLRVLDFGLAKALPGQELALAQTARQRTQVAAETATQAQFHSSGGLAGTPLYMAPEQWMEKECDSSIDVWALGVILYELLSGHRPYDEPTVFALCARVCESEPVPPIQAEAELPTELEQLVADCLAKEPGARPSIEQVVESLHGLVYRGRARLEGEISPFRGLLPFTERHADLFFGRDGEVAAFLERLREVPVLPVVGPSGAGKSSFVQAGAVPRLREGGRWVVLATRPGRQPFEALAARLVRGAEADSLLSMPGRVSRRSIPADQPGQQSEEESLAAQLAESPTRLSLFLQQLAEQEEARVLLLVDQLEELYTLVHDDDTRRRFMEAICSAADDPEGPVRVVFTLRDDFMVRLAETPSAREVLGQLTVLRSPGPEALKEILTQPLRQVGYRYEDPELVGEMVDAVGGEPACLPLLQFACSQLWESRDREERVLRRSAYDAMGGVEGALARQADDLLAGLTPSQVDVARQIFLRLITPEGTRRVVPRSELVDGLGDGATDVLDRLVKERAVLVRKSRRRGSGADVELVHESLIRNWQRMRRWIDESREELAFLAEVGQAAALWQKRGRRDDEVWQGEALHDALRKAERLSGLPEQVRRFLDAGQRKETGRVRRRRTIAATGITLLTLIAIAAVVIALVVTRQAEEVRLQRNLAEQGQAEALREGARAALARQDVLEARAKLRGSLETQDSTLARVLWLRLLADPLVGRQELGIYINDLAVAPDGQTVAAAGSNKLVYLTDVRTQAIRLLRGHTEQVYTAAFAPDGALLASGTTGGELGLWDLERSSLKLLGGHERGQKVTSVAFSPDGSTLASASYDRTIRLWNVATGDELRQLELASRGGDLAFSPDGKLLASTGPDGFVRLWDVASGRERRAVDAHAGCAAAAVFSPDGTLLASTGCDRVVRLWDVRTGEPRGVLTGQTDIGTGVAFAPDGRVVAAGSWDKTVRLWDVKGGEPLKVLEGHTDIVTGVAFGPRGRILFTGAADQTIRFWNLDAEEERGQRGGHDNRALGVEFSPDERLLASVGTDQTVRLWDVETGQLLRVLVGHTAIVKCAAFSPDGALLATGGIDGTVRLWETATGEEFTVLRGHAAGVNAVAFSPDGKRLASGCNDRSVRLWDVTAGTLIEKLDGHEHQVCDVAFGPDGTIVASGSRDKTVRVWDATSGDELRVLSGHGDKACPVRFSSDGTTLISGSRDTTVRAWDVGSWSSELVGEFAGEIYDLRFDGDQRLVGVQIGNQDLVARRLGTDQRAALPTSRSKIMRARFSPTGRLTATSNAEGVVRLWETETGRPVWRAPVLLNHPFELFSHQGWTMLDPRDDVPDPPNADWREAAAASRLGAENPEHQRLCLATHDDQLELWDLKGGGREFHVPLGDTDRLFALPAGCLVLTRAGEVRIFDRTGTGRTLHERAGALSYQPGEILVAAGREIITYDETGKRSSSRPAAVGITAMLRADETLILGHREGDLQQGVEDDGTAPAGFNFEDVPASRVEQLLLGPRDTLIVGYANGFVGVWSQKQGTLLHHLRLHGAIAHLTLGAGHLFAVTDLGDHEILDLGVFDRDYCDLVRDVWDSVPVVWSAGRAVVEQPPADHPCAR